MIQIKHRNDFGILLNDLGLFGKGIEIGVAEGNYSDVIVKNFNLSKIYLLDAWKNFDVSEYQDITNENQFIQDKRYLGVVERFKLYGEKVEIIRGDAREEFKRFPDDFFDFVYIDANHKYTAIKEDMNNWYSKVKTGGVFAGHDYMDGIKRTGEYGVKSAVNEFCHGIKTTPLITGGTFRCPASWYFQKS